MGYGPKPASPTTKVRVLMRGALSGSFASPVFAGAMGFNSSLSSTETAVTSNNGPARVWQTFRIRAEASTGDLTVTPMINGIAVGTPLVWTAGSGDLLKSATVGVTVPASGYASLFFEAAGAGTYFIYTMETTWDS